MRTGQFSLPIQSLPCQESSRGGSEQRELETHVVLPSKVERALETLYSPQINWGFLFFLYGKKNGVEAVPGT